MMKRKRTTQFKYDWEAGCGNESSNKLTEKQLTRALMGGGGITEYDIYRPSNSKIIEGGSWIIVIKDMAKWFGRDDLCLEQWAMYWAIPYQDGKGKDGYDQYGRYMVEIIVPFKNSDRVEKVNLFSNEYIVITDENKNFLVEEGLFTVQTFEFFEQPRLNLELLNKRKELTDDEKIIIDALMLDGLTESEACEEFFLTWHTKFDNRNIFFRASKECIKALEKEVPEPRISKIS